MTISKNLINSNYHTKGEERGRAPGTSLWGKPCIACGDASVFEQKIVWCQHSISGANSKPISQLGKFPTCVGPIAITYNIHSQSRADSSDRRPMTDTSEQCVVESQDLVQETVSHCLFASLPAWGVNTYLYIYPGRKHIYEHSTPVPRKEGHHYHAVRITSHDYHNYQSWLPVMSANIIPLAAKTPIREMLSTTAIQITWHAHWRCQALVSNYQSTHAQVSQKNSFRFSGSK